MASKGAENTLNILGSVLGLGGQLIFGPDFNADLGAPFKAGAGMLREKREQSALQQSLMDALRSNPHTAPIADLGEQVHSAGGILPNLMDSSGMASAPDMGSQMGGPLNESLGMPTGGASALNSTIFSSPEFIAGLSNNGASPELIEKMIYAQSAKSAPAPKDPLDIEYKKAQIQALKNKPASMTPEEKAALEIEIARQKAQIYTDASKEKTATRESYPTGKQIEALTAYENAIAGFQSLPDTLPDIAAPVDLASKVPGIGNYVVTKMYPEIAQFQKQLQDLNATKIFAAGGKNLTGTEKNLLFPTLPSLMDNPEYYPIAKKNTISRIQLSKLANADNLVKLGKKDLEEWLDPQTLADYGVWKQIINKSGPSAFQDPEFMQLSESLGLGGLYIPGVSK